MSDIVLYEVQGRVALITLNRPEARNAVNGDVAAGLEAAIDRMEDDPEVWVGIIRANTEGQDRPVFSAGADLKAINSGNAASLNTPRGGFAGFVYRERRKPVIVAVDGLATAGGCEIVLAADLVVATTRSAFGLAEVKRNLIAGAGGLFRLPRAIGQAAAMEAILTGEPIPAERAYQLGLVSRLVAPGEAVDRGAPPRRPDHGVRTARGLGEPQGGRRRRLRGRRDPEEADERRVRRRAEVGGHEGRADRVHREAHARVEGSLTAEDPLTADSMIGEDPMIGEELHQPGDHPRPRAHLGQRHPCQRSGVVAGARPVRAVDRRHEVVDDEVPRLVDPLHDAERRDIERPQAGLLVQLPAHRRLERLAPLHPASGNAPRTPPRSPAPLHQEELAAMHHDGADAHLGMARRHQLISPVGATP